MGAGICSHELLNRRRELCSWAPTQVFQISRHWDMYIQSRDSISWPPKQKLGGLSLFYSYVPASPVSVANVPVGAFAQVLRAQLDAVGVRVGEVDRVRVEAAGQNIHPVHTVNYRTILHCYSKWHMHCNSSWFTPYGLVSALSRWRSSSAPGSWGSQTRSRCGCLRRNAWHSL